MILTLYNDIIQEVCYTHSGRWKSDKYPRKENQKDWTIIETISFIMCKKKFKKFKEKIQSYLLPLRK